MKTLKQLALCTLALSLLGNAYSQTADQIISKYLDAVGGKDKLTKITSVYTESTLSVMGSEGTMKTTLLNGKGMRQDIDIMGNIISSCFTDKGGWSINPMMGSTTAEAMPEAQYNAGKDQIFVGGQFINWAEKGYKAELVGTDSVEKVNAYKIRLTLPDNTSSVYYFDTATSYLVRSVQQADMQGQMMENIITYSDYKPADGYLLPNKLELNMANGQFMMDMTVTKVQLNIPVDETIFVQPQ